VQLIKPRLHNSEFANTQYSSETVLVPVQNRKLSSCTGLHLPFNTLAKEKERKEPMPILLNCEVLDFQRILHSHITQKKKTQTNPELQSSRKKQRSFEVSIRGQ
jgi:hypothetical protein